MANRHLIEESGLDIHHGDNIGYVVQSACHYKSDSACACGSFTHVFVSHTTERPVAISGQMRSALTKLLASRN